MDPQLLECLLYQEESETLDFKVAQYPFDGATDEQKGELLKDILAFANAWRQTDAYILIGVEEVRGGRSIVRGVTQHLLNQNLQQFVQSKTNRPVILSYAPVPFEGAQIGVLTIPLQERPVYVLQGYGRLEANVVYIRRGDTTGKALPDEVARMGASAVLARAQPVLELDFVDPDSRKKLGTRVQLEVTVFEVPTREAIPLYGKAPATLFGTPLDLSGRLQNREYYRDIAAHLRNVAFLRPLGLAITNSSPAVAQGVLVTLELDGTTGVSVLDDCDKPASPSTQWMPLSPLRSTAPGRRIDVARHGDAIEVRVEFEAIQPGVTAWSHNVFHIGARQSMTAAAKVTISAHNLREPVLLTAEIGIEASSRRIEVSDIIQGPGQPAD